MNASVERADREGSESHTGEFDVQQSIKWPPVTHDEYQLPPERCHPHIDGSIQTFDVWDHKWHHTHSCDEDSVCYDIAGKAMCVVQDYPASPPVQQVSQTERPVQTRCEPLDGTSKFVQYLHPVSSQWVRFYQCGGRCSQFPDFAACEEYPDKFVVPNPPTESLFKRDVPRNPR